MAKHYRAFERKIRYTYHIYIYLCTIEYYLVEKKKALSFSENSKEVIMLSKISQTKKDIYHTLFHTCRNKNPSS